MRPSSRTLTPVPARISRTVSLARQVPPLPRLPVGLHLAPGAAHRVLADLASEQPGQRPANPPGVGAGKVGVGNQRLGALGQPPVGRDDRALPLALLAVAVKQPRPGKRHRHRPEGADKLAIPMAVAIPLGRTGAPISQAPTKRRLQFLRNQRLDEAPDVKPDRLLQRIEPILTGKWNRGRRCFRMFHGVSSFRRSHTAGLNGFTTRSLRRLANFPPTSRHHLRWLSLFSFSVISVFSVVFLSPEFPSNVIRGPS